MASAKTLTNALLMLKTVMLSQKTATISHRASSAFVKPASYLSMEFVLTSTNVPETLTTVTHSKIARTLKVDSTANAKMVSSITKAAF